MKQLIIRKSRMIAAIFSEVEASQAIIMFTDQITKKVFNSQVSIELKHPFESSLIKLPVECPLKEVTGLVIIHGRRVSFNSNLIDERSLSFPKQCIVTDLRTERRLKFSEMQYAVEVRYRGGTAFGFGVDFNVSHMLIEFTNKDALPIESGDSVEILVKRHDIGPDLFFIRAELLNKDLRDHSVRALFSFPLSSDKKPFIQRPTRSTIAPFRIGFHSDVIDGERLEGSFEIYQVSISGFSAKLVSISQGSQLVPGLSMYLEGLKLRFIPVRVEGDQVSCVISSQTESEIMDSWFQSIQEKIDPKSRPLVSKQELFQLFTDSALLKGQRRTAYGDEAQKHILPISFNSDYRLMIRAYTTSSSAISDHVSAARLSDHSYLLQEGASGFSTKGDFAFLLNKILRLLKDSAISSTWGARYVSLLWHRSVRSADEIWREVLKRPSNRIYDAVHLSAASIHGRGHVFTKKDLMNFSEEILVSAGRFDLSILQSIDFFRAKNKNVLLSIALKDQGEGHRPLMEVYSDDEGNEAICYRVLTYYGVNVTGVYNSVFVFVCKDFNLANIGSLVATIRSSSDLALGTDDYLVISNKEHVERFRSEDVIKSAKIFNYGLIDLLLDDEISDL